MTEQTIIVLVIVSMAIIVYLTRVGGYLLGLKIRHLRGIRPILEALPGCAFMAILVPALRQGNATEILAMICVAILMWLTDNVAIATIIGVCVLLFAQPYLSMLGV